MVPKGWVLGCVGDLLIGLESGVSVNGEDRHAQPGEKSVLKVSAVSYGCFDSKASKVIDKNEISRAKTKPRAGQIIVSRSNTESFVGASAYVDKDYQDIFLPDKLWQTVPKPDANMKWLSYVLASEHVRYTLSKLATGTSGSMKNITKGELLTLKILIPPLPEQKKIAQTLSIWETAIATTQQLLVNSKQQKKALMQQLLTGEKRLAGFNQVWNKVKVSKMGSISSGGTPDTTKKEYWDGDISWLTPTDVTSLKSRYVFSTNKTISEKGLKNSSAKMLPRGALLICTRATIGAMAISTTEIATNQGFKNLVPNAEFSVEFLYYLFTFNVKELVRKASGSTFLELSKSDFEKLTFLCPCLDEQHKIASVLIAADDAIAVQQQKIHYLKQEKKALMQQLLTGKRRVKTEAA